jgi:hypothetical protein
MFADFIISDKEIFGNTIKIKIKNFHAENA